MSRHSCRICFETKSEDELQELNCHHKFCSACLNLFPGLLCPTPYCVGTRCTDVVVDEMQEMDEYRSTQISFGSQMLSVIDIEEKVRCEAMKGQHPCANIARMHLLHCRHQLCFDCLAEKLQQSLSTKDVPHCPLHFCSNRLSPAEIRNMALRAPHYRYICDSADKLPIKDVLPEMSPTQTDIVVECFAYGREQNKKSILIPKLCMLPDVISAVLQLQRLSSNRSTSSVDIYCRKEAEKKGQYKYERVLVQSFEKTPVRDMNWPDRVTLVVDLDGQVKKGKQRS